MKFILNCLRNARATAKTLVFLSRVTLEVLTGLILGIVLFPIYVVAKLCKRH